MSNEAIPSARAACVGLIVADSFVSPVPAIPPSGALAGVGEILHVPGGCAVNTATTLTRLGIPARLGGCVGADGPGAALLESLSTAGIDVASVRQVIDEATSETVILTVAGEDRRYFHVVGANAAVTSTDVATALTGVEVVVVGGFLALPSVAPHALAGTLAAARSAGVRTVLDVVVPLGLEHPEALLTPVLPHVDFFVPNDDEARAITGLDEPEDQARALLKLGCRAVVITLGARGAVYADGERMLRIDPMPVEFVDGSGAGDAYTAGLVFGLLEGFAIDDVLRLAAAVGASATRGLGCTTTVFTREEALAALPLVTVTPV